MTELKALRDEQAQELLSQPDGAKSIGRNLTCYQVLQ